MPPKIKPPVGKAKISNIPTLPKINEVDGISEISNNLTVLVVVPPDGGFAWVIVAAAFVNNFLIDGIVYSFGLLLAGMADKLRVSLAQVALIGSVQVGVFYLSGPFVCVAVQQFGFRKTAVFGAVLSAIGMFAASWCKDYLAVLVLYGVLGGLGNGIVSSPSVIIVGYYFEKYRAIATGLAMCGSSAGIIILSPVFSETVSRFGWERTMQIQAGLILCVGLLSLLTFKAISPAKLTVEEDDLEPYQLDPCADAISETSSQIEFSYVYGSSPHVKVIDLKPSTTANSSAVQMEQFSIVSRRTGAVSMKTFRSRYTSVYHGEPEKGVSTSGKCCSCCSCCKPKPTGIKSNVTASMSLRTGPLNRQDIFYSGSLIRMSACKNDMKQRPDLQIEKATEKKGKCRITLKPFVNLLRMLIDVSLLKSPTYGVISLALFLYIFGLFTPYVYLAKRCVEAGISKDLTIWLVSILSLGNLLGRFVAGFVSFFPRIDPSKLVACTTMVGSVVNIIAAVRFQEIASFQICYACIWGFFVAFNPPLRTIIFVKYLGLDRLTNAFGLSMLVMGIAALAGSPTAGILIEIDGTYTYAFVLSGGCQFMSGLVFLVLSHVHKREVKRKKLSRKP